MNHQHSISHNRSFLVAICSALLSLCPPAHAQTEQGPTLMSQLNSDYYVGAQSGVHNPSPTIQSAITKTCALPGLGSRVIIPAGSPAEGTAGFTISAVTGGCVKVAIEDRRAIPTGAYKWVTTGTPAYILQSSGGSSSFPGGPQQVIVSAGSGAGAASAATMDAAGDAILKSFGGTNDANFLKETTPHVSNDAIKNSLQTAGNFATVNQAYPATEFHSNGLNIRVPQFIAGSFLFGVPTPGIAYNTGFFDYRANNMGLTIYNPNAGEPSMIHTSFYKDDDAAGSNGQAATYLPFMQTNSFNCCGVPQAGNTQSNNVLYTFKGRDLSWGIKGYDDYEYACEGVGDCHLHQHLMAANGGCNNFSDECSTLHRNDIHEDMNPFFGTVPALAKGTKVLPIVFGSSSNAPGEGRYIANISQQGAQFHILSTSTAAYPGAAAYTTDTTFANETYCQVDHVASASGPPLTKGLTTSTQVVLGNCSAAITTASKVCVAGAQGAQHVNVTAAGAMSGGAQTISVDLERPTAAQEGFYQGPNACKLLELLADQKASGATQPHRTFVRVLGHAPWKASNVIDFVSVYAGGWTSGPGGNFNEASLGPTTLTRDGSGTVCTPLGTDFSYIQKGVTYRIATAANTSYNGVFTVASENPGTNMCWSNPGTAGSTTTSGASWAVAPNGFDDSAAVIGPGELVMQAENPATRSADGTVVVEANDTTPAANDIYASSASEQNAIQVNHDVVQWAVAAVTGSANQGMIHEASIVNPPEGFAAERVGLNANTREYLGGGGFKLGPIYRNTTSGTQVWRGYDLLDAPTTGGFLRQVISCGLRPCSDPGAYYDTDQYAGSGGVYDATWHANTNLHHTEIRAVGGTTAVDFSGGNWQVTINDGAGSSNFFQMTPFASNIVKQLTVTDNNVVNPVVAKSNSAIASCTDALSASTNVEWGYCSVGASGLVASNGTAPANSVAIYDKTNNVIAAYFSDSAAVILLPTTVNSGPGHTISTGTASNTDLAGQVTLAAGAGTQSLVGTYTSPPIVVCTDTTAVAAVKCSASTTAITITGTGTDVINYITIGRN